MLNYLIDPVLVVCFAALKDNTPLFTVLKGISNNRWIFTDQNLTLFYNNQTPSSMKANTTTNGKNERKVI